MQKIEKEVLLELKEVETAADVIEAVEPLNGELKTVEESRRDI
jgi:hypothetical protein